MAVAVITATVALVVTTVTTVPDSASEVVMRGRMVACLLGMLPVAGGCTVARQIDENMHYEKDLYCATKKHYRDIRKDAEAVLKEVSARHPHKVFSPDFRCGFYDGFKDYLEFGGPCRPPASPPPKYRTPHYLTPEGHCQVRDYFLGFQYGIDCAISTGMRKYYVLPILMTDEQPPPALNIVVLPPPPEDDGKKEIAPPPKLETKPMTPAVPMLVPKIETKVDPPKADPPKTETPKAEVPKAMPSKVDPPKPETPKVDPPKPEAPKTAPVPSLDPNTKPIPPVEVPKVDPPVKPPTNTNVPVPVPAVPTGNPPPIPLVPSLPNVSLGGPPTSAIVPVQHTEPAK